MQIFDIPKNIYKSKHPCFTKSNARAGLFASAVIEKNLTPVVELGLVEKTGNHGGLGAGLYTTPMSIFTAAAESLEKEL